jgi:hypothetical protein
MADQRLQKTRDVYPPGGPMWRRPSENAAEQIARAHSHRFVYSPADLALRCACGERVSSLEAVNKVTR